MDAPMNDTDKRNPYTAEELTFLELLKVLGDYRWLIVAVTAAVVITATVLAFTLTPVYRAEVLIAPADSGSGASTGGISSLVSRLGSLSGFGGFSRLAQQDQMAQGLATLESPRFTRDFIEDNNLLPVLFAGKWDAERGEWNVEDPEDIPTLADGYVLFKEEIRNIEEMDSGIYTLSIEWTDPELAAQWANELVSRLNERLRRRAIDEANQTIEYLNGEVEKTRVVELQQAIYAMIESQINVRTMANVRDEFSFKVISPAIPAEEDRFVFPNRPLFIAGGVILGPVLGVFLSFLIFAIRRIQRELRESR